MTLKEMGKTLGVSPSTISKVLNNSPNFSIPQELRERILDHVDRCGYSPNPIFRSMRINDNKQLACFFYSRSSLSTGSTVEISVDAAITHLEGLGYEFYYQFCTRARKSGYPQPNWKVAGILIPDVISPSQLTALEQRGQLYVTLNGVCGPEGTAVQSDETQNMTLALEQLRQLGHRRIAYVSPDCNELDDSGHYSTQERFRCYMTFMREHDLEPLPICAPQHTTDWIDGVFAVKPTAVITVDEMRGMLFFRAAHERGISIPKTISLLVFNDVTLLSLTTPAISSIQIAAVEMGTLAGKILEKRILDPSYDKGKTYRLPGKLMLRETTAVPGQ